MIVILSLYFVSIGLQIVVFHPQCLDFGKPNDPVLSFIYDWMSVPVGLIGYFILASFLGHYGALKDKAEKYDKLIHKDLTND